MPRLHLIRHAEPSIRGVLLGATDPPLSDAGREAATSLRAVEAEAVYTSPLRRARETAEAMDRPTIVVPEFAEINFGVWDGLAWSEIEQRWPDAARAKLDDWLGVTPPGGEPWSDFIERVAAGLAQVRTFPAAIVAHVAVNAAIAGRIDGRGPLEFQQAFCEVITLDVPHSFLHR